MIKLGVPRDAVINLLSLCTEVCEPAVANQSIDVGTEGCPVQIDE